MVEGDGVKRETDEWDSSGLEIEKCQKINEVKKRRNIYGRLKNIFRTFLKPHPSTKTVIMFYKD